MKPAAHTVDDARLGIMLNELRLPTIKTLWPRFAEQADREGWPAARFLAAIAEHELSECAHRRIARYLAEAHLPPGKTLDSFAFEAVPMISKAQVSAMATGDSWLAKGANVLMFRPPGGSLKQLLQQPPLDCFLILAAPGMVDPGEPVRARRLTSTSGIGALNATALVAAVGNAATFTKGRELAAWLGLVPRQATTGGKTKLLGITKRGRRYLRKMLIQGARSAMPTLAKASTAVGARPRALLIRAHPNVAVVALAAKMARTVWALLRYGRNYETVPQVAG